MSTAPEPLEGMARELFGLDVDLRLREVWKVAGELTDEEWTRDRAATAIRAAYAFGYRDAMRECDRREGELTDEWKARQAEAGPA